jgi:hypothetical protein
MRQLIVTSGSCFLTWETERMNTQKTQREVLHDLVAAGKISLEEAQQVRSAPERVVPVRELMLYLGGLLVFVGLARIAIDAFQDASSLIIALVLYFVAAVCIVLAIRLQKKAGAMRRFGEILELAAMLAGGFASGIVLSEAGVQSEISALICSAVIFVWSFGRLRTTTLVGSIGVIPSIFVVSIMVTSLFDVLQNPPYVIGVAGLVLIGIGMSQVALAVLIRTAGLILVAQTAITLAAFYDVGGNVAVGAFAYTYGAIKFYLEMLIVGAVMVVTGVVMFAVTNIENDVAQGLVIIGAGIAALIATYLILMRRKTTPASV